MRALHRRTPAILDTLAILPLAAFDPAAVEALLDAAFGPERRGRTAYRLRAGLAAVPGLSFGAVDADGALIGSLQSWPVALVPDDGGPAEPLLLIGPIAVRPDRQQAGIGRALTDHALRAVDGAGETACVLIGDPDYYERFFGFSAAPTAEWRVPGPVERHRLLARLTGGRTLPVAGALRPHTA